MPVKSDLKKEARAEELYTLSDAKRIGEWRRVRREALVFSQITRDLPYNAVVLEIGSGKGDFAELAHAGGFRYVGVEPSSALRSRLLQKGYNIIPDPVPPIRLGDETVDLVHSSAVIEHFESYSAVLGYFKEARRVLKTGGLVSTIVPNCDTLGMIFYLQDYQHNYVTNQGRLEHLARDLGFETIAARSFLTNIGLTPLRILDRIFAHLVLLMMRSPLAYSLTRIVAGKDLSYRIYKNLFDQTIVVMRKR